MFISSSVQNLPAFKALSLRALGKDTHRQVVLCPRCISSALECAMSSYESPSSDTYKARPLQLQNPPFTTNVLRLLDAWSTEQVTLIEEAAHTFAQLRASLCRWAMTSDLFCCQDCCQSRSQSPCWACALNRLAVWTFTAQVAMPSAVATCFIVWRICDYCTLTNQENTPGGLSCTNRTFL